MSSALFNRQRRLARQSAATLMLAMMATMTPLTVQAQQVVPTSSRAIQDAAKDKLFLAVPEAYLTAQRGFDAATLAALTDPDFVEISPVGEVDLRAKMLSFYTPDKKRTAPPMRYEQVHAWKNGPSGTIIGKVIYTMTSPAGEMRTSELTATFQLHRSKGKWKLVAAQYTPVRASR